MGSPRLENDAKPFDSPVLNPSTTPINLKLPHDLPAVSPKNTTLSDLEASAHAQVPVEQSAPGQSN
jgi:hypothetical protein